MFNPLPEEAYFPPNKMKAKKNELKGTSKIAQDIKGIWQDEKTKFRVLKIRVALRKVDCTK